MRPLTAQDVLRHQAEVPWPHPLQVEQDLRLCQCMHAIFSDGFLREHVAMRGGTVLHKVHLAPAARYSEDIDLVLTTDRDEAHIAKALKRVLRPVLGKAKETAWGELKLAIRNAVRPSRILRSRYEIAPLSPSPLPMTIVVETNVSERRSHRPVTRHPFRFALGADAHECELRSFDIHEMLGTKMRALFQRTSGRDLFDLHHALSSRPDIEPAKIVESFLHYLHAENSTATRDEFVGLLGEKLANPGFRSDMDSLLRSDMRYDVDAAGAHVGAKLLQLLPA